MERTAVIVVAVFVAITVAALAVSPLLARQSSVTAILKIPPTAAPVVENALRRALPPEIATADCRTVGNTGVFRFTVYSKNDETATELANEAVMSATKDTALDVKVLSSPEVVQRRPLVSGYSVGLVVFALLCVLGAIRVGPQWARESPLRVFIPTTCADLLRRTLIRILCCAVPSLLVAYVDSRINDSRFLSSFWFWWCVVLVPVAGLTLDLWRLSQARTLDR